MREITSAQTSGSFIFVDTIPASMRVLVSGNKRTNQRINKWREKMKNREKFAQSTPITPQEPVIDRLMDALREEYPNGHPAFIPMSLDEVRLHSRKNADYAGGGNPLGNFNRVASILSCYPDLDLTRPAVVAIIYALKQLDAILFAMNENRISNVESLEDKLRDLSVYAKLVKILLSEE